MNPALLGLLGAARAAIRPAGLPPEQVQGADFASLLEKARTGEVSSGRGVEIARGAGVVLSPEQLAKIAVAADQAEANGATRALVMIDGLALRLDVTMREITGAVDMAAAGVLTDIDAVVNIPGDGRKPSVLPVPRSPAGVGNASLLKVLAEGEGKRSQAA
jgi:hypothetical protein